MANVFTMTWRHTHLTQIAWREHWTICTILYIVPFHCQRVFDCTVVGKSIKLQCKHISTTAVSPPNPIIICMYEKFVFRLFSLCSPFYLSTRSLYLNLTIKPAPTFAAHEHSGTFFHCVRSCVPPYFNIFTETWKNIHCLSLQFFSLAKFELIYVCKW